MGVLQLCKSGFENDINNLVLRHTAPCASARPLRPRTSSCARLAPRSTASSSATTSVSWVERCTLPSQSSGSAVRAVAPRLLEATPVPHSLLLTVVGPCRPVELSASRRPPCCVASSAQSPVRHCPSNDTVGTVQSYYYHCTMHSTNPVLRRSYQAHHPPIPSTHPSSLHHTPKSSTSPN